LCELPPKRGGRYEVDERLHAVNLDHRDQLTEARLQFRVTVDRNFLELEPELLARSRDRLASTLAEMAPSGAVEPNASYG